MAGQLQRTGQYGETLACDYLTRQGFRILARNWRDRLGELDLIAADADGLIVFVEVKARRARAVNPLEKVTARKRAILIAAAERYLARYMPHSPDWRFDLIAVTLTDPPQIDHFPDAFDW
jgi:putative endonuclease